MRRAIAQLAVDEEEIGALDGGALRPDEAIVHLVECGGAVGDDPHRGHGTAGVAIAKARVGTAPVPVDRAAEGTDEMNACDRQQRGEHRAHVVSDAVRVGQVVRDVERDERQEPRPSPREREPAGGDGEQGGDPDHHPRREEEMPTRGRPVARDRRGRPRRILAEQLDRVADHGDGQQQRDRAEARVV